MGALVCVVVFCTTYALILPAITEETDTFCGYTEHVHDESCRQTGETAPPELICSLAEAEPHTHTEDCVLPAHTHTEDCWETPERTLLCEIPELEGHTHSEECYETQTAIVCGQEESEGHTHDEACYAATGELVCTLAESAGHTHTAECSAESVRTLICTTEETAGHLHEDACYSAGEPVLICGLEERAEAEMICTAEEGDGHFHTEGCYAAAEAAEERLICEMEEHTHTLSCHSNPNADIENPSDWETTFADVELSGVWAEDLLAIAESQLGYQESTRNFIVLDDGETTKGYTRYGAWYGDPYGDWCAMFVSFCLHYAQVPEEAMPQHHNCAQWIEVLSDAYYDLYAASGTYTPAPGDLIFFDWDGDQSADHVGLVQEGTGETITTIEGNSGNRVKANTYAPDDRTILGYGILPANPNQIATMDLTEDTIVLAEGENDPYNLYNYVHTVTVQHKADGETVWQDVENGNVQTGDSLRFTLQYLIPGGTLDADHRTVTYQLPVQTTKSDSGNVYDEKNNVVGTYTITEDGLITIVFNEDYATSNASGYDIAGNISFETTVDALNTDTKGDVTLPFTQEVTLHVTDKVNNTGDLQVTKTAANINPTAGTVDYTITVNSENGTGSTVLLNDVMTGIALDGTVTVKDKNGNTQNITVTEDSNGSLSMELPQMNAGGSYTITYSAKLPNADTLNGSVTANNTVDVQSTDKEGGTLVDEDDVDTTFTREIVSKSGTLSEDGSTITWTIKVNASKVDIGGWTLSDTLGNSAYTGDVTISPNPNNGSGTLTTTLPYKFPAGSDQTYTVTYTTTVDTGSLGSTSVSNTATMTPGSGSGVSAGDRVTTGSYNPLTKEAAGVVIGGTENGNKLAEYKWTVTIDASDGAIEPYTQNIDGHSYNVWYYGDELWNESTHWMTGTQIKAMAADLDAGYDGRFEVIAYVWTGTGNKFQTAVPLSQVSDTAKYGQFRILFYDTLPQGQKITFSYASTGNVGDGTASKELTNWGTVNNKVSDQASQSYRPVVTKVDKNGSGSTTEHNIADSKLTFKNGQYIGVLGWNVKVTLPDTEYTFDVVITEDIPYGTDLLDDAAEQWSLSFALTSDNPDYNFSNEDFNFKDGKASITKTVAGHTYTVTAELINGDYVITIPKEMATHFRGKTISLEVRVQIDENFNWDELTKRFTNTVTVTTGNTELGQASQTQIIRNPVVTKSSTGAVNNVIPYSLTINSEGRDLMEGADTLTLTDVLSFPQSADSPINASLLVDTVKVYSVESDGTKTDITAQCPYTFTETETDGVVYKTITMTVPDSTPLLVEYSYRVTGKVNASVTLSNTATLEGQGSSLDDDDYEYKVTIEDSNATAILKGVKIVKVDAENYSLHLKNASFDLEKWNGSEYVWIETFTTDEDGTISTGELATDVAYRLIETDAPDGYLLDSTPYEFYIVGSGTLSAPRDFNGKALNDGDSIIIANAEAAYTLPETGGIGTIPYTTAGLLTMLGSGILLSRTKRKTKRKRRGCSAE